MPRLPNKTKYGVLIYIKNYCIKLNKCVIESYIFLFQFKAPKKKKNQFTLPDQ